MLKKIQKNQTNILGHSQYNWDHYWKNTAIPFRGTSLINKLLQLLALYSARSSLKLLSQVTNINTILELGGGTGCLSAMITKKLCLNKKALTLIDCTKEAKQVWREVSRFGKYIIGDFNTYNFKKTKFDLVLSAGLIEHWQNKKERLHIIRKHTELSNKYVMIRVPRKGGLVKILELKEKNKGNGNFEKLYTKKELKKEISQAGLKILGIDEDLVAVVVLAQVK